MNGAAGVVLVKPLVVMAARVLGPGPTRLRLVKLAHQLGPRGVVMGANTRLVDLPKPAARRAVKPSKRAA